MITVEKGPPEIDKGFQPHLNEFDEMETPGVDADNQDRQSDVDWMQLASDAMEYSTQYLDANYRKKWEDGIRAFNNQHPLDSKYNHPAYAKRSNLYRPKIRAAIRKNEAAGAAAFFSNMDVVNVDAIQQSDKAQKASADVMKQLLQYRLTTPEQNIGLPWFHMTLGALQDAQTVGVCVSRQYWDYQKDSDGKKIDKPCVELIPVENLRIDPAAKWYDPIGTSPYVIELMPMYLGEVREMMDAEENPWTYYSDAELQSAANQKTDSTRLVRNKNRTDPDDNANQAISDYEIIWVQRHIHRRDGKDWVFYCLGDIGLLTDPKPLIEEVFTGERDYVMGFYVLETHKVMPSGVPELARSLSDEIQEVTNQRLDNVKLVLNKRWLVKRGKNTDAASLVRNVPGGVTMTDDPEGDIKEVNWPDVTQSSFEEQNRLNADFSDLLGDFSPANAQLSKGSKEPARVMQLMAQSGTPLTEYGLRCFTVSWVEPVLRQLIKLEQKYETDTTILAIAADRAQIFQKYGINGVTDELLNKDLTLTVNVGMGATDPVAKLQKFNQGLLTLGQVVAAKIPGLNLEEVSKEEFALMGYQDGKRFMTQNPEVAQLKQALEMKDQAIHELGKRHADELQKQKSENESKEKIALANNVTKLEIAHKGHAEQAGQQASNQKAELEKVLKAIQDAEASLKREGQEVMLGIKKEQLAISIKNHLEEKHKLEHPEEEKEEEPKEEVKPPEIILKPEININMPWTNKRIIKTGDGQYDVVSIQ